VENRIVGKDMSYKKQSTRKELLVD